MGRAWLKWRRSSSSRRDATGLACPCPASALPAASLHLRRPRQARLGQQRRALAAKKKGGLIAPSADPQASLYNAEWHRTQLAGSIDDWRVDVLWRRAEKAERENNEAQVIAAEATGAPTPAAVEVA